jgi:hypothetical protein
MCVKPLPESLRNASGADIDRLIAAQIACAAGNDWGKAWDIVETYSYTLGILRDKDRERREAAA